jgi:hypothetical protein
MSLFVLVLVSPVANAEESCWKRLDQYVTPPQFEDVEQCKDLSVAECFVLPHCCTGACIAFPECTFVQTILVDDGTMYCSFPEDGFQQWLDGRIYNNAPDLFEPFLDIMRADGQPLPPAWREYVDVTPRNWAI